MIAYAEGFDMMRNAHSKHRVDNFRYHFNLTKSALVW